MNCDCKTKIEDLLQEQALQEVTGATDAKADLDGYGLSFAGGSASLKGFMTYKVSVSYEKKGQVKEKRLKGSMIFSHCPFCGAPAGEKAPEGQAT